jgi:thermostable 8-oxoguanine DNA glycosylase
MEQTTPMHAVNHYRKNRSEYDQIDSQLDKTRNQFFSSNRSEQIRMLQKSHSFAVISVQTPVHIHENAFRKLWQNDEPLNNIEEALQSVNYRNNKEDYIRHSINNSHLWADVTDMLENDKVDKAHKFIIDNMKGVGPAKAPFTLAMLGFKSKACIDGNIIDTMGLEKHVNTVVVEKYDNIIEELRNKMPTLKKLTSPFLWQWVVFSYTRNGVSGAPDMHEVWFDMI